MKEITPNRRDFMKLGGLAFASAFLPPLPDYLSVNREYSDVLNEHTQAAISAIASSLSRSTYEGAVQLSDWLNNTIYSDPNNICGPLAIHQLIGTVTYGVTPYDLWLANIRERDPEGRTDVFARAFPKDRFDDFDITTPIVSFDFNSINLQPGDFIYMRGANGRGADHMMTMSRRDQNGAIWAMTNYPGEDKKYIVKEVQFWNPKNPESSFVRELAKGENSAKFSSGQGGFVLYRLKKECPSAFDMFDQSQEAKTFRLSLEDMIRNARGKWSILITDIDSGKIIAENSTNIIRQSASVIKVPLAMCVMSVLESKAGSQSDLLDYVKNNSFKGVSFDESLTQMLVNSDEQATARMAEFLASQKVNTGELLQSWGVGDTNLSYRKATDQDYWRLFMSLYNVSNRRMLKTASSHRYLLNLLSRYSPDDSTRLGMLSGFGVTIDKMYHKIGSIAGNAPVVADSGIVEATVPVFPVPLRGRYFISINGQPKKGSKDTSYNDLEAEFTNLVGIIAGYMKGDNAK